MAQHDAGEDDQGGPAAGNGGQDAPARLLIELGRLRKQARSIRHAYWLPLVLFGLVIGASSPFYLVTLPSPADAVLWTETGTTSRDSTACSPGIRPPLPSTGCLRSAPGCT